MCAPSRLPGAGRDRHDAAVLGEGERSGGADGSWNDCNDARPRRRAAGDRATIAFAASARARYMTGDLLVIGAARRPAAAGVNARMATAEAIIVARRATGSARARSGIPAERALYWIDFYGPRIHRLADGEPAKARLCAGGRPSGRSPSPRAAPAGARQWPLSVRPANGRLRTLRRPERAAGRASATTTPRSIATGATGSAPTTSPSDSARRALSAGRDGARDRRQRLHRLQRAGLQPGWHRLYFSDTAGRRLIAYRVEAETGRLVERRTFADLSGYHGVPDGLAVDVEGNVWCALYGEGEGDPLHAGRRR